jgi:triosephosphate isomerase
MEKMTVAQKRRPFVAGNWKMHMLILEAIDLVAKVRKASPGLADAEIVVLPPFTALNEVDKVLEGSAVRLGAQNLFWEEKGAYTGEVSAGMLRDAGCQYAVIGHSERRLLFGETDSAVNKKIQTALRFGLKPIVCIGETLDQREGGKTIAVIEAQLGAALEGLSQEQFRNVVIAYEPVWAIGTGRTATPDQAEEVQAFIRRKLAEKCGKKTSDCAIIIYGGSVKPDNAFALFLMENIDGFLVGGASLEADSFLKITGEAIRAYREKK